jgi:tetratricopeptide (TPR) repeat protein
VQRDVREAGLFDDDDLGAITAALESELLAPELSIPTPDPEAEQSLEDVFAAFRQHVATEIDGDDYRTHYDLGIAYKEMGLLEDSIEQFRRVLGSAELHGEALAMLAVCLRDAGRIEESVRSYREAIAACGHDDDVSRSLRYELADVLLVAGDAVGALGEFRGVLASDPSFRDVRERVAQLES